MQITFMFIIYIFGTKPAGFRAPGTGKPHAGMTLHVQNRSIYSVSEGLWHLEGAYSQVSASATAWNLRIREKPPESARTRKNPRSLLETQLGGLLEVYRGLA